MFYLIKSFLNYSGWQCSQCTYQNSSHDQQCEMCLGPRSCEDTKADAAEGGDSMIDSFVDLAQDVEEDGENIGKLIQLIAHEDNK